MRMLKKFKKKYRNCWKILTEPFRNAKTVSHFNTLHDSFTDYTPSSSFANIKVSN